MLKGMLKDFSSKVELITTLNLKAGSKLDSETQKKTILAGKELKSSIDKAMKGDEKDLNNFIKNHADIH